MSYTSAADDQQDMTNDVDTAIIYCVHTRVLIVEKRVGEGFNLKRRRKVNAGRPGMVQCKGSRGNPLPLVP